MADKKEDPAVKKRRELRGKHGQVLDWADKHGPSLSGFPEEHLLAQNTRGGKQVIVTKDGAKLTDETLAAAHADLIASGLKEPEKAKGK